MKTYFNFSSTATCLEVSIIALCLQFSEYLLVQKSSSITLSLAGIIKDIFMIFLAGVIKHEHFSNLNTLGLIVCFMGIGVYSIEKYREYKNKIKDKNQHIENIEMLQDEK
ncbi:hypothetical protein A3Q56_07037 [Intoshia linei]|uniref:Sugar phosphate transporter domain-containing protein n=1 Tax=Intoshia linei TaxID=1819745 RepID=A0A177AT79_9BILA|nr:hypothetical protein A3Q56_07037 [Intoshia linei]